MPSGLWFFYGRAGRCLCKQQRGLNCSLDRCHGLYIWMTGRLLIMFLIVRLLTSVTFSLSPPLPPPPAPSASLTHTYIRTHAYTHCSPSAESPLPKHLCHLSLSSLKPLAAALRLSPRRRGMIGTGRAKREKEDRGDNSFIPEGSYVLKGAALAAKTFLWHVSNWYFEMAAHSAEVMGQFRSSADWEMRVWCWRRREMEVPPPAENSKYHLQQLLGLFYRFLSTSPSSSSMSHT